MASENRDSPLSRRISRRRALGLGAAALGTLSAGGLLAACGGSDTPSATATSATGQSGGTTGGTATQPPSTGTGSTGTSATPAGGASTSGSPVVRMGSKKNLIVASWSDPSNLNPIIRSDISGGLVQYNLMDNLVWPNYQTREIEPGLAERWALVDPTTWRIKLREGVQWHKGYGEVTADDLAYTWNYVIENKTFQISSALFPVQSVSVVDKYTAEVKLKQPFGAFPGVTMGYGGLIVSKKAHQEMGNETYSIQAIGTGPYVLESWNRGAELVAKKNAQYWQKDRPYLDEIVWRIIPDSHVRLQALQKGEVDYMSHPDAKDVKAAREDKNLVYTSVPGWNWDYQTMTFPPYQQADFPNQNKLVRQAISYAIDREAIVQQIYYGEATITDNAIPPGYLGHQASLLKYPKNADLNKAKELMAQAGVRGYEVEVITSDKDWLRRELELVASMVSQIGITYKIRGMDIGSFNNLWLGRNYQQLLEDITLVSPDPDSCVWWFYHTDGSSWGGYSDPALDKMLDDARAENDPRARETLYHNIVATNLDVNSFIYHCNVNYVRLFKKGLAGYQPSPQEYIERFDEAYWEA